MSATALERLRDTGGFTLDVRRLKFVSKGFAVSVNPERTRTVKGDIDSVTLLTYVTDNSDLLRADTGKVFGAWLDTETGITYLDVVTIVDTEAKALEFAIEHGELAVYDIAGDREIRTGLVKS